VGSWPGGFQAEVRLTNAGDAATRGWSLGWTFAPGQVIANSWGGLHTQNGATVSVKDAGYNANLAAGATVTFGFIGRWTAANPVPATVACSTG
jgi:hypothetical protein